NNAYLTGPSTAKGWLPTSHAPYYAHRYWAFEELSPYSCAYWAGNTLDGALWKNASGNADPMWLVSLPRSINPTTYFLPAPVIFANAELPAVSASTSTASVLSLVGASLRRDAVDLRVINQVQTRTGRMIDSPKDVGGWPVLSKGKAPADKVADGLPDSWEQAKGLDPASRPDSIHRAPNGRTWLEVYHNQVIDHPQGRLSPSLRRLL
ncbi:MAG: pectate lyase, partial [Verrucomicrobiaceae bacterium]|nr:pectate lyase [Verrucomicrobiaceae bacterium]